MFSLFKIFLNKIRLSIRKVQLEKFDRSVTHGCKSDANRYYSKNEDLKVKEMLIFLNQTSEILVNMIDNNFNKPKQARKKTSIFNK